ncbi:FG-GAP repeat protein [Streptomyces sp. NPDC101118]|uniref:FG-GAP repeat protein n=1 Tax=Streptomyces sp. NPDC101118 TaxID=3366109 RepID=UPI003827D0CD
MIRAIRAAAPALAVSAVLLALGGCAAPGGLGVGEPAPAVSAQPRPEELWPAWAIGSPEAPGAAAATRQPPPEPLPDGPAVPAGGMAAVDPLEVLRADKRMKPFLARGMISGPGHAGIRPPVLHDLTGDGKPDLVIGADLESGRSAIAVYTARDGRVVPVLYTSGRRMAVEALQHDLLVRTAANDGAEQAVRYRWDGRRLSVVSDEKRYRKGADL